MTIRSRQGRKPLQVGCEAGDYSVVKICQNMSKYTCMVSNRGKRGGVSHYSHVQVDAQVLQDIICLQPVDASMFARKSPSNPPTT